MRRITAETVLPRLFAVVANDVSPSDLLSVDRTHAGISVGRNSGKSRTQCAACPASIDARLLNRLDQIAFAAAEDLKPWTSPR